MQLMVKYTSKNKSTNIFYEILQNAILGIDYIHLWNANSWLDSWRWTLNTGPWTVNSGLWTLDSGCWTLDAKVWTLDAILWTLSSGHWTLSLTVLKQNQNPVSASAWLNYWKFFGWESPRIWCSRLFCRDCRFWRGYF